MSMFNLIIRKLIHRHRRVSINAIASFCQVVIVGICYFFLYKYLLNHLGAKELGLWSLIVASSSIAGIGNLGIGGSVVKFVAAADAHKDYTKIKIIVHTGLCTVLSVMGALAFILYLTLPGILSGVVSQDLFPLALQLLPLSLLNFLLGACTGVLSATIDGIQFIYIRNFIASFLTIVYLGLAIFFVPQFGLIGVVYAQIAQTSLIMISYLVVVYWKIPGFSIIMLQLSKRIFKELFGYGLNFQIISLSSLFFDPITKYFLSKYGGLNITGYYEMANKLVSQLRSLIVSTLQVIVPAIANVYAKGYANIRGLYIKWFPYLFLVALILITYIISLAAYISIVWVGRLEAAFIVILVLISVGQFFNIISVLAYFIDLGAGDLKWNVVSHVVMAVSNVIFSYLFGRILGGYYVALGVMLSLIISSIVLLIPFHKEYTIKFRELFSREMWMVIGISLSCIGASYFFYHIVNRIIPFWVLLASNILIVSGLIFFYLLSSNLFKAPLQNSQSWS